MKLLPETASKFASLQKTLGNSGCTNKGHITINNPSTTTTKCLPKQTPWLLKNHSYEKDSCKNIERKCSGMDQVKFLKDSL